MSNTKNSAIKNITAALLCVALAIGAGCMIKIHGDKKTAVNLKSAETYDEVYNKINSLKLKTNILYGLKDGMAKGSSRNEKVEYIEDSNTSATTNGASETAKADYSKTTTQVEGVDEADIVKTDGKYIYILSSDYTFYTYVKIIDSGSGNPKQLNDIKLENFNTSEMFLSDNRLVLLGHTPNSDKTAAVIYDVTDPEKPKKVNECKQSGGYADSRLINGKLYIVSSYGVNTENIKRDDISTYVPYVGCGEKTEKIAADCIYMYDKCMESSYTVVCGYDIKDGSNISAKTVFGGLSRIYASTDNIIATSAYYDEKTQIARFEISDGKVEFKATGEIKGYLLNQFSIDEYKGHFRFVLTEESANGSTQNSLVILDGNLKETGKIENIAKNERVYSVRFMGDVAYFVTFRQVDPLFSVDVSDPTSPKIIGSLKIPGFSDYLFPYGEGKLLGVGRSADATTGAVTGMKLSLFDISNPANVTESFKTEVGNTYSEALTNHKATLADADKNLIAFPYNDEKGTKYLIYSLESTGFALKAEIPLGGDGSTWGTCRGLYIGKLFYAVSDKEIAVIDMQTFQKTAELKIK